MITIPTGDFTGILADVIPFASTDDEMPTVNCVRLEWSGTRLDALTTDRYRIGISEWEPGDIDEGEAIQDELFSDWGSGDDPWRTTIDLADAKELVKVFRLGEKEYSVPLTVDYEHGRARLTVKRDRRSGHSAITVVLETAEVEFPDVRSLLAKNDALEANHVTWLHGETPRRLRQGTAARAAGDVLHRPAGADPRRHRRTVPRRDHAGADRRVMDSYFAHLRESEKDREETIRAVPCPACLARKKARCKRGGALRSISCTGRYDLAAQAGLVPRMAGT